MFFSRSHTRCAEPVAWLRVTRSRYTAGVCAPTCQHCVVTMNESSELKLANLRKQCRQEGKLYVHRMAHSAVISAGPVTHRVV
jgi:hypothetical protein